MSQLRKLRIKERTKNEKNNPFCAFYRLQKFYQTPCSDLKQFYFYFSDCSKQRIRQSGQNFPPASFPARRGWQNNECIYGNDTEPILQISSWFGKGEKQSWSFSLTTNKQFKLTSCKKYLCIFSFTRGIINRLNSFCKFTLVINRQILGVWDHSGILYVNFYN